LPQAPQRPNSSPSDDPMAWITYNAEKENYDYAIGRLNDVHHQRNAEMQRAMEERQQQMPQIIEAERARLLDLRPALKDPKAMEKARSDIYEVIPKAYGWSQEQIAQVTDAGYVAAMLDLVEYQKIKSAAPAAKAKVETKPPLVKPAKRANVKANAANSRSEMHDRLRKTGSRQDAVAILKALQLD